jgi:hypothetical protein
VEQAIRRFISAMDDEQRQACRLYQKELRQQQERRITLYKEILVALEAEFERREKQER